jgi:hypothetical protein
VAIFRQFVSEFEGNAVEIREVRFFVIYVRTIRNPDVDLSALSVEALDGLLVTEWVSVATEDELLRFVSNLGPDDRDFLRYIQRGFLSILSNESSIHLLPYSIRASFRSFRQYLQSLGGNSVRVLGEAAAIVLVLLGFTAGAMAMPRG